MPSNGIATEPVHDEKSVVHPKRREPRSGTRHFSGDETFSCSVCTTFTGDVPSLIEHMRCHHRSHVCRVPGCVRRFSTSQDLIRHTKSAHSNTILTCHVCFAVIKGNRVDNLKRHIRNRHPAQAMAQASPSNYSSWSSPGDYTSM
ncbi:hypothetical protein CCHR01_04106 [Colletotrichum chrysophilum]|uniref:C2H2-type domain-containing protein n=1 Tax=Colletotrichum chrysophilum TaxID=1836956 RepID=A0AAD9AV42_9PEZI|nr:hypothetical protein CCHR01_04106 [Colletotrichum chrysophilum]